MSVIADTHVHLYPCYNRARLLDGLHERLAALAPEAVQVACLTEAGRMRGFDALSDRVGAWSIASTAEAGCLRARRDDGGELFIVAGRQIVTLERVEILALATLGTVADGRPAVETVAAVLETGALPVVSWAPGKWFFSRGKVVATLLNASQPGDLAVGDTSLRATCWPEPVQMRRARQRGLTVLAGSDPLPFTGEEVRAGTYATVLEGVFDRERPVSSLRDLLRVGEARRVGRRNGALLMGQRLLRHARA